MDISGTGYSAYYDELTESTPFCVPSHFKANSGFRVDITGTSCSAEYDEFTESTSFYVIFHYIIKSGSRGDISGTGYSALKERFIISLQTSCAKNIQMNKKILNF